MSKTDGVYGLDEVYATTFCNQGHRLRDGKPVGHNCYILDAGVLETEAFLGVEEAMAEINAGAVFNTGIEHKGIKQEV